MTDNINSYQSDANQFCSPSFYPDGWSDTIPVIFSDIVQAAEQLDVFKRALVYDDREKYALSQQVGTVPDGLIGNPKKIAQLHALLGLATEVGELLDAYLTDDHNELTFDVDKTNVSEEAGDQLWYLALLAQGIDVPMSEIARANIRKLDQRYPGRLFTTRSATERDLVSERAALEG